MRGFLCLLGSKGFLPQSSLRTPAKDAKKFGLRPFLYALSSLDADYQLEVAFFPVL
jgi:hypothetical protein